MASYKDNDPKGWCGDPKRGAALGRSSIHGELGKDESLSIIRKQLDTGGYDENGTYFGLGDPLFWVSSEDGGIDYVLRAKDIGEARAQVAADYPGTRILGDLYNVSLDNATLQDLLNCECESCEEEHVELNDEIIAAAQEFETAVWCVLTSWVSSNLELMNIEGFESGDDGVTTAIVREMSCLGGGAGYLYYMEHQHAGVGTCDGDWDHLFKDRRTTINELSEVVKKATHEEYQKLNYALINCAEAGAEDDEDVEPG